MENEKKIILTEKRLDFLLGNKSVHDRTKPVPTPSAQYTTLGGGQRVLEQSTDSYLSTLETIKNKNPILHAIGWLLFTYGLRVSEVLNIQGTHLRNGQKIWIPGLKRSGDRYINYSYISSVILSMGKNSRQIFEGYSRHWVYREFKKLGIEIEVKKGGKKAVTHAGRHLVAQELKSSGDPVTSIQGFYQHKSVKSTEHYASKKK